MLEAISASPILLSSDPDVHAGGWIPRLEIN
jgi:hypothetical protein